ncbi:hypothetical protein RRG08_045718 [Elysia crispata]|uniref:Uncharacterized protein n=1 Tax=Elysia crispata TaxID=231223 RepID=A0AAE0Z976_9GAST|nr:hypothetical protein RRG08_045718 [Elysia crispata]
MLSLLYPDIMLIHVHRCTLSQARKNHLKKCAKDKGMTVDQLKLLMKQQEEDYAAKLDAGILPEEFN